MTGRRGRLARLETQRQGGREMCGIFEANLATGVWREVGGAGRTLPLSPEDLQNATQAQAAQTGLLLLAPLGGSKIVWGIDAEAL